MISVIIPAYNAARTIGECLAALSHQTIDRDTYEVIVVDDGSTDATAAIAAAHGARVLTVSRGGPAAARNQGVAVARGELILFTDADCVPTAEWIERMVAPLERGADGVKGAYLTRQRGVLPRFIQADFEERYRRLARAETIDFVDTYAAGYRRDALAASGGFDTGFPVPSVEDIDLSFRLAERGRRLVFEPRARVYHYHVESLSAYLLRKWRYGVYRVVVYGRYPEKVVRDSYTPRLMLVEIALAGLMLAGLAGSVSSQRWLKLAVLFGFSHLALSVPFAVRAGRCDPVVGLASPLLILLRSLAQATGIVVGVARVAGRLVSDRR